MRVSASELLRGLPAPAADAIVALATRQRVAAGTELFRLGGAADSVFVVERGRILLTLPLTVGGCEKDVLIEERSPGQAVGWSALVPPHLFTLNATAPLDSEVLAIPRLALAAFFADDPAVGAVVMRNVAEIMGQRLQVYQTMWLREMQRGLELRALAGRGAA
jgi:CRP/FNR family transcriptional regulator, cyclic AMP receptor protein